jgi:hypothetical protein
MSRLLHSAPAIKNRFMESFSHIRNPDVNLPDSLLTFRGGVPCQYGGRRFEVLADELACFLNVTTESGLEEGFVLLLDSPEAAIECAGPCVVAGRPVPVELRGIE